MKLNILIATYFGINLPPRKCRPLNERTPSLGAVKLTRTSDWSPIRSIFPSSTSQPDGMSTETIGRWESVKRDKVVSNGARIGPLNEKPKIASKITFEEERASRRRDVSSEGGIVLIFMLSHWLLSRYEIPLAYKARVIAGVLTWYISLEPG